MMARKLPCEISFAHLRDLACRICMFVEHGNEFKILAVHDNLLVQNPTSTENFN